MTIFFNDDHDYTFTKNAMIRRKKKGDGDRQSSREEDDERKGKTKGRRPEREYQLAWTGNPKVRELYQREEKRNKEIRDLNYGLRDTRTALDRNFRENDRKRDALERHTRLLDRRLDDMREQMHKLSYAQRQDLPPNPGPFRRGPYDYSPPPRRRRARNNYGDSSDDDDDDFNYPF